MLTVAEAQAIVLRHSRPLPRSIMPLIMAAVVAAMGVLAAVVVLVSALH